MNKKKIVAVIPARLSSSRLHEKVLLDLGGVPIVVAVYNRAKELTMVDSVVVATDSLKVMDVCKAHGVEAILTSKELQSGSDRVYQATKDIHCDYIINIQGDEPFFSVEGVDKLVRNILANDADMGTIGAPFMSVEEFINPNNVKIVLDKRGFAKYFSRAPIPYTRDGDIDLTSKIHHIGIYIYKKAALELFVHCEDSILENDEKLEQLRFLDAGEQIYVEVGDYEAIGIDTEEDYKKAIEILNK